VPNFPPAGLFLPRKERKEQGFSALYKRVGNWHESCKGSGIVNPVIEQEGGSNRDAQEP